MRTAVVGLGWAARSIWLPRLVADPGLSVTDLVDPDPAARDLVAAAHAGARVHATPDALDPGAVDLVVVAVPNHLHGPVAAGLLRRGIAVFVEKPVCLSSAQARELAAAERSGGAVLLAGSATRYRSDVRELVATAATLGTLRHLDLAWVRASGVPDAGGWFTDRALAGGGALLDLGWHLLDAAAPLLGGAEFGHLAATVSDDFVNDPSRRAGWRPDRPDGTTGGDGDVEDTVRAFLVSDTGVSVTLRASWASHEARDTTRITVEGSAGTATLRGTFGFSPNRMAASELTRTVAGRTTAVPLPDAPVGIEYDRQLAELPRLLSAAASRGAAIAEAGRSAGLIERIYASARAARGADLRQGA